MQESLFAITFTSNAAKCIESGDLYGLLQWLKLEESPNATFGGLSLLSIAIKNDNFKAADILADSGAYIMKIPPQLTEFNPLYEEIQSKAMIDWLILHNAKAGLGNVRELFMKGRRDLAQYLFDADAIHTFFIIDNLGYLYNISGYPNNYLGMYHSEAFIYENLRETSICNNYAQFFEWMKEKCTNPRFFSDEFNKLFQRKDPKEICAEAKTECELGFLRYKMLDAGIIGMSSLVPEYFGEFYQNKQIQMKFIKWISIDELKKALKTYRRTKESILNVSLQTNRDDISNYIIKNSSKLSKNLSDEIFFFACKTDDVDLMKEYMCHKSKMIYKGLKIAFLSCSVNIIKELICYDIKIKSYKLAISAAHGGHTFLMKEILGSMTNQVNAALFLEKAYIYKHPQIIEYFRHWDYDSINWSKVINSNCENHTELFRMSDINENYMFRAGDLTNAVYKMEQDIALFITESMIKNGSFSENIEFLVYDLIRKKSAAAILINVLRYSMIRGVRFDDLTVRIKSDDRDLCSLLIESGARVIINPIACIDSTFHILNSLNIETKYYIFRTLPCNYGLFISNNHMGSLCSKNLREN